MELSEKLSLLAASARYDVSCASSGSRRRHEGGGPGSVVPGGICHSYTEDGRCVSLLKVLLTNHCIYDCAYCANRESNDIPRTALTTRELVDLTIHFYRRNYIEGLFLSSGIVQSPDATMERLVRVVKVLREQHGFGGYIHLKCIPGASEPLVRKAGLYADRLSVNIEIPTDENLRRLTARKNYLSILTPMGVIRDGIVLSRDERKRFRSAPLFAPAGQSTQLVVGASPESDYIILNLADRLYREHGLRRVYYSAYVSVNRGDPRLPALGEPPLRRENRLYQADWLLRFYGFSVEDLLTPSMPFLDLKMDPKMKYALANPELFPVDVNRAEREMLLRVPGIGLKSAEGILDMRRCRLLRWEHLQRLGVVMKRASAFVTCSGRPIGRDVSAQKLPKVDLQEPSDTRRRVFSAARFHDRPTVIYDGTFSGLLSVVFELFARKLTPLRILAQGRGIQTGLFETPILIETNEEKAAKTWRRLGEIFGDDGRRHMIRAHLSGVDGVEELIHGAVAEAVKNRFDENALTYSEIRRRIEGLSFAVGREAHRMEGLVRFEKLSDGFYTATIRPRYDVLPLICDHFERRFADVHWVIYDMSRDYGLYFNISETLAIHLDWKAFRSAHVLDGDELVFQRLWKKYFDSLSIPERRNPDLHLRMLPRRYWPLLPEKRPSPVCPQGHRAVGAHA